MPVRNRIESNVMTKPAIGIGRYCHAVEMPVMGSVPGMPNSFIVRAPPVKSMNRPHSSTTTSVSTSSTLRALPPTGS